MTLKKSSYKMILLVTLLSFFTGCSKEKYPIDKDNTLESKVMTSNVNYEVDENGTKSKVVDYVITDRKILTLTFQGLGNKESLTNLLDELDKFNIKATFFVSGVKVAEEPELAKMVVNRGHEIGNATLSGIDLTNVNYTKKMTEIEKSHDIIEEYTGVSPRYVRPGHNKVDDEVMIAASQAGYEYIVNYGINPQDWNGKTEDEIGEYIDKKKQRGGIVILSLDKNPNVYKSIESIFNKLSQKSFDIVPLKELISIYEEREENKYVLPSDWYKQYENNESNEFRIINNGSRNEKKIVLTFDDWATDDTVDSILDTLDEYNVKATFFLRAKGVETNPSLAYAISERGHEIASHTYSHIDLDKMTLDEVKKDIIKAHEVITNAINKEPKKYLRPPRGIINDEIAKAASECGYKDIIMYGPSALDWKVENSASYITNYMLRETYNGEILLLHILDDINTPEALPDILSKLKARGYEFITVGEMIGDE